MSLPFGFLGCPFRAESLGNISLRGSTVYDYRFQADGGTITGVRLYLIFRAAGYFSGNGGQVKVAICEDDGTELDSYTDTSPMTGGGSGFKMLLAPLSAALTPGDIYRIRVTNPTGSSSNWVSVNDLNLPSGETQPGFAEQQLGAYQDGDLNPRHTPVFTLYYSGGATQGGPGYIDVPSSYNASNSAQITITADDDYDVQAVVVGLQSGSGTINANLGGTTGSASVGATPRWVRIPLVKSLASGNTYTLTLTGNFLIRPLQKGTTYGFADPSPQCRDVRASNIMLPIYFEAVAGGGSPTPPVNLSPPVISGIYVEGETLSVSDGAWDDLDSLACQWRRCNANGSSCSDIVGETGSTYELTSADVGSTIRAEVTGTNATGDTVVTTLATPVIVGGTTGDPGGSGGAPENVVEPHISGVMQPGRTLTMYAGEWDGDTPMTFTYRWLRGPEGGPFVAVRDGQTYPVTSADIGYWFQPEVTAHNDV